MKEIGSEDLILGLFIDKEDGTTFARIDEDGIKKIPKGTIINIVKALDELRTDMMSIVTNGKVNSESKQVLEIRDSKDGFEVGYNKGTIDEMSKSHFKGLVYALREAGISLIKMKELQEKRGDYPGMQIVN